MQNPLNETVFEEHIAEYLANSPLYNKRVSAQFDIDNLCDHDMLEQFLRQQPKVWAKLTTFFPGRETSRSTVESLYYASYKKALPSKGQRLSFASSSLYWTVKKVKITGSISPTTLV